MSEVLAQPTTIDKAEAIMFEMDRVECTVQEGFFGGFYIRQTTMPAGARVASKIHKTRHPFVVTKGRATVYNELGEALEEIAAGHVGITEPKTRRLLLIHEECVWTTFHFVNGEMDRAKIENIVIEPHLNPILGISHAMLQSLKPTLEKEGN